MPRNCDRGMSRIPPGASNLILTRSALPPSLVVDGMPSSIIPWKSTRGNLPSTSRLPAVGFPPPINPPAHPPSILALVSRPLHQFPPPSRPSAINPSLSPPSNRRTITNAAITRLSWLPLASPERLAPPILPGGCPLVGNPPAGTHPSPGIRLGDWVSQTLLVSLYLVYVPLCSCPKYESAKIF